MLELQNLGAAFSRALTDPEYAPIRAGPKFLGLEGQVLIDCRLHKA
jgi:hypothetical protein